MAEARKTSLEARDKAFYLDGKKLVLLSGAMHYFRVVPEYWRDRMLKMKACGLNCLETYVVWNLHEEVKGHFNFDGLLDLRKYIKLAQELGLYVILRPGPYICAEWDLGGLPSWLLSDPEMKIRSSYKPYLDAVDQYFAKLLPLVKDLQYVHGGPIIAVQLENEYGSYGDDQVYMQFLKDQMKKNDICELFVTSDNGSGIQHCDIPGAVMTLNFQEQVHGSLMYKYARHIRRHADLPLMVMEFWSGWFDHWGDKHEVWPVEEFEKVLKWILEQQGSVNFYMFHGGTNFGFINGANDGLGATNENVPIPYQPDITSYDYDCLIAENGDLTPKYFAAKELFQRHAEQYVPSELPTVAPKVERTYYGTQLTSTSGCLEIKVRCFMSLENVLSQIQIPTESGNQTHVSSSTVLCMEQLPINNSGGQSFGFIMYRTTCRIKNGSKLTFCGKIKDRAQVMVNSKVVSVLEWMKEDQVVDLETAEPEGEEVQLDILVENLGRVNYADFKSPVLNNQHKGLVKPVLLDGTELKDLKIYPLEFKKDHIERLSTCDLWSDNKPTDGPVLIRTELNIDQEPKDTYLLMKDWRKGCVFVNGFNLGRYWNIGPQQTLYLPAPLLRQGQNEILVFETDGSGVPERLTFCTEPDLGETTLHTTHIPASMHMQVALLERAAGLGDWVWSLLRLFIK